MPWWVWGGLALLWFWATVLVWALCAVGAWSEERPLRREDERVQ